MADIEALEVAFQRFTAFGSGQRGASEMESSKFNKALKESGVYTKKFKSVAVRRWLSLASLPWS